MRKEKFYTEQELADHVCTHKFNSRLKDLQGKTTDRLTVLKLWGKRDKHTWWFCRCTCGNIVLRTTNAINSKEILRCSDCSAKEFSNKCKSKSDKHLPVLQKIFPHLVLVTRDTRRWTFYCTKCNTEFRESQSEMVKEGYKGTPCRCDNGVKFTQWTTQLREEQILERCSLLDVTFVGWVEGGYTRNTSRITLKCNAHEAHAPWEVSINNFLGSTMYSCPDCGILKRSESSKHTLEDFKERGGAIHNGKFDYSEYEYICARTPSIIRCTECGTRFPVSYDNHIRGKRGCPGCSNKSQKELYIILMCDNDAPVAIKYGKANHSPRRFKEHQGNTDMELRLLGVWSYEDNINCSQAEQWVKKHVGNNYLSKEVFTAGYTETIDYTRVKEVIEVYERFGGKQTLPLEEYITEYFTTGKFNE